MARSRNSEGHNEGYLGWEAGTNLASEVIMEGKVLTRNKQKEFHVYCSEGLRMSADFSWTA